jgi:hypothetical protein
MLTWMRKALGLSESNILKEDFVCASSVANINGKHWWT